MQMPTVSILSEFKQAEACEHSNVPAKLECGENRFIDVVTAAYGVLSQTNGCGRTGNCPPAESSLEVSAASNCNIQSHI